ILRAAEPAAVSGPLEELNEGPQPGLGEIEIKQGRVADVGGIGVLRVLPTKKRRTVGPWCFVDLMHPGDVAAPPPMRFGPHPLIDLPAGRARIIVGSFEGVASRAGVDHPAIGLDVNFEGSIEIPLDPVFEHAVVPVDRTLKVQDALVEVGALALVPSGYQTLR